MNFTQGNKVVINQKNIKCLFAEFDEIMKSNFAQKCLEGEHVPTEEWTGTVLKTFREIGKKNKFTCDSSFPTGEYLFDLCWTTYPSYPDTKCEYDKKYYKQFYNKLKFGNPQIILSLESEWGVEKDQNRSRTLVLDDFCKIRDVKAPIKVMVFGFHNQDTDNQKEKNDTSSFQSLVNFMKKLMVHPQYNSAKEYYLLYGICWKGKEWERIRKAEAYLVLGHKKEQIFTIPD